MRDPGLIAAPSVDPATARVTFEYVASATVWLLAGTTLGLIASMIPTTLAGHAFWDFDGAERKANEIQFLKNAGLVGGLLLVLTRRR